MEADKNGTPRAARLNSARSATTAQAPAPDPTCGQGEPELIIGVRSDGLMHYEGTAAQLIAEGLIPKDLGWPRAAAEKRWAANGFEYFLRRARPDGHKGSMRSWLELDNWFIRVVVTGRDYNWHARQSLKRQGEELAAAYYRQTAAGSAEQTANWHRYLEAVGDKAFQAFKAKTPGLIRPKRGRKPKALSAPDSANGV